VVESMKFALLETAEVKNAWKLHVSIDLKDF
jgi:hypothetical protein